MERKLISWITILAFAMTILPVLPHAAEAEGTTTTTITMGTTGLEYGRYYRDADNVSSWANEVMSWANATCIINGTIPTTLDPQGTATRVQVVAMLGRFVLLIAE